MPLCPAQHRAVGPGEPSAGRHGPVAGDGGRGRGLGPAPRGAQEPPAQHRHDRQGDDEGGQQGDRGGHGEGPEQLAGQAAHEGDGQEHGHGDEGGGGDRGGDLARAVQDRGAPVGAQAEVPADVLHHHDRVVHDPADRDRQRPERQRVEGVAEGRHPDEGGQQGQRNGHGGDEGGAHREQEHGDHQHGERQAQQALLEQRVDGLLDERGLVEHHGQVRAAADQGRQLRQGVAHGLRDRHEVGVRGRGHGDGQRRHPVGAGQRGGGRGHEGDVGDLVQGARFAVAGGSDDDPAQALEVLDGGARLDGIGGRALGDLADGEEAGVLLERVGDVGGGQPGGGERGRVRDHGDVLVRPAEDVGAADAVDLLQPRGQDVLGAAAQGVEVLVPGQGEEDHREVGDGAREGRGLRLLRQLRPQVGHHAVHLGPGPVQVCAVGELQLDRVEAGLRRGPRGFEPLHGLQGRLEGLAHLSVHDLGGRPRVERRDGDDGQLERGDQLPLELPGGEDAEHRDEHGDERHERPPTE